jgi:hypothetical protein
MMEAWGARRGRKVQIRGAMEARMAEALAGGLGVGGVS